MESTATSTVPSDRAWSQLGEYLQREHARLVTRQQRKTLLAEWREVSQLEDSLEDAILIGLVGGTGVGKSTFINALAGEAISQSGDRRPTTSRVVVYRYAETELPDQLPVADLAQPQVMHRRGPLEKVVLFDFPDFDSAERSHEQILKKFLPFLDVLLVVVDDIKYGDRRLYELLRGLQHDPSNLYVILNKTDRLEDRYAADTARVIGEIHGDLRTKLSDHADISLREDQLFSMAARQVLADRSEGKSTVFADFSAIEDLLDRYQKLKHRRAAKERNLDARKSQLVQDVRRTALAEENRSIIGESQRLIAKWRGETEQSLAVISTEVLSAHERRAMRGAGARRASGSWGVPISLLITLICELRRWRGGSEISQVSELGARIQQHYRGFFESLSNLRARIGSEIAGTALAQTAPGPTTSKPVTDSPESLSMRLGREFQAHLNATAPRPRIWRRWACHLPALFVLVMSVWSKIYPLIGSLSGTTDQGFISALFSLFIGSLSPTFIVGIVVGVLLAYFVTALFVWVREIQKTDQAIYRGERDVREGVREFGDDLINALDHRVETLHEEFERVREAVGVG